MALAWKTDVADPALRVFLATMYTLNQGPTNARLVLQDVRKHFAAWDRSGNALGGDLERNLAIVRPKRRHPLHLLQRHNCRRRLTSVDWCLQKAADSFNLDVTLGG